MSAPTVGSITSPTSVPQAIPFSPVQRTESLDERMKDFKTFFKKELAELYPDRNVRKMYKLDDESNLVILPTNPKDADLLFKRFRASYDLLTGKHSSNLNENSQASTYIESTVKESVIREESFGNLPISRAPSTIFEMEMDF